jgi:dihydrofolate reductase
MYVNNQRPTFNIVVACQADGGIGANNGMPWKTDLKHFAQLTTKTREPGRRNVVIMGRNTFLSIGRPLPNRINAVVSASYKRTMDRLNLDTSARASLVICGSVLSAIKLARYENTGNIYVIGGGEIYNYVLDPMVFNYSIDKIYVTKVNSDMQCDKFFPIHYVKNKYAVHTTYKTGEFTVTVYK